MAASLTVMALRVLSFCVLVHHATALYPTLGHTQGQPWPMPKSYMPTTAQQWLNKEAFTFTASGYDCDILQQAFRRYYNVMFYPGSEDTTLRFQPKAKVSRWHRHRREIGGDMEGNSVGDLPQLSGLDVMITLPCDKYPSLNMEESCKYRYRSLDNY